MIPQIEVLRAMLASSWLTPKQRAAITDVINHFDACLDCIALKENENVT